MLVKSLGGLILFLTAAYFSYTGQRRECDKETILTELYELFNYIQKSIECYTVPLGEIYRGYSSPKLKLIGFYNSWQNGELADAVNKLGTLSIPDDAMNAMQMYALHAGKGYKDTELKLCCTVKNALEEVLVRQKKEIKDKRKLYRTLPFLLVLSMVLLFT